MKCKSKTTHIDEKTGRIRWYVFRNEIGKQLGYLCSKCYFVLKRRGQLLYDFKHDISNRHCSSCGVNKTTVSNHKKGGYWYKDGKGGWWCNTCHHRIKVPYSIRQERNSRRMKFKDKIISLSKNPRKGICEWCNRLGLTQIHHIEYHKENPLKDTVELCPSCHRKETIRLRKVR